MTNTKMYFVRTNACDRVITFDGTTIRMIGEVDFHRQVVRNSDYPHLAELDALDFLGEIEDDSGWDIVEFNDCETAEQVLDRLLNDPEGKVLAELEADI